METKLDPRILSYLKTKGINEGTELDLYLNPSLDGMFDPFLLKGMKEGVKRIKEAIEQKQKIVIYGDYDCDGISACVILYKYFKSQGISSDVYIPNRFDDGYGLSFEMIDEIKKESNPDLIITVDLGVTAIKEVERIKELGIDIIVSDHHEMAESLPSCIVIDPKIPGQDYPFNGLCGAGVALKIVEAMSSREEIKKYLDIAAIATIGDIVPLVSENRIIAKKGLEMLEKGEGLTSLNYMMKQLGLSEISGTDITFKIVPRLNSSGRMSQGKKVFDFLISENQAELEEKYVEIANDNEERLKSISEGVKRLEEGMKKIDLTKQNIILLKGVFHQGVLGILASRICHDYNRPTIIFTETEEGTLKGSGRSIDEVNLHALLMQNSDLLIRFGGHKMAVGVEVSEENFDSLSKRLSSAIKNQYKSEIFTQEKCHDIEITEEDIDKKFINSLKCLEPFGCQNERPVLMLRGGKMNVMQMKAASYKHFKINTKNGKSIMNFNGAKNAETLRSMAGKELFVELENNVFKGKTYAQAVLKDLQISEIKLGKDEEREVMISLIHKSLSLERKSDKINLYNIYDLEKLLTEKQDNLFGTIVIVDSEKMAQKMRSIFPRLKGYTMSHIPLRNAQNTVLVSRNCPITKEDLIGYKNVIFTRSIFPHEKDYFADDFKVYVPRTKGLFELGLTSKREVNVAVYNLVKKHASSIYANNIFEEVDKLYDFDKALSKSQIMFSILGFMELGFISINLVGEFSLEVCENPPKKDLLSSKLMNAIRR